MDRRRLSKTKTTIEHIHQLKKTRRQRHTYFGMKCIRIPFKTGSDCLLAIIFVFQIVRTGNAVAVGTKLTICKAFTVTTNQQDISNTEHNKE